MTVSQRLQIRKQLLSKRFSCDNRGRVPGFLETAEYLRKKANRLDGQEFTVALFGAFSAGKSSFSNALIGEQCFSSFPKSNNSCY